MPPTPLTSCALLLTDVVDSTRLVEALGDTRMAEVWARHDRVARDLLPLHRGREIDKTDGFLLLFDAPADAVAYAVAYHRAIGRLEPPLKARAGLHVGSVILTENTAADVARGAKLLEVDGIAKRVAARVMSVAVGGQTLATPEAVAALGPTDLRVASHGHWQMKGVAEPVELFEVGGADAPFTPPPDGAKVYRVVRQGDLWLPVKQVKHNLPSERDAFVGREADLRDLARRIDDGARLVSLLGLGGTGKTRLATHYAWTWLGSRPGGAWFCDLSEARSVEGILYAVATALDVPLGKDDPIVQLGHAIAGRGRCLVVLDNFEQVTRHAAETLGRWLDRASGAQFVVTTREVLGLPGEATLALASLAEEDGAALFVARALQAERDFVLIEAERPHVRALVKLLDGLPLAIELAAARVRLMPPSVLVERMQQRFRLLTSTGGRHTRQATLRATLDWSWELLSPDEQQALAAELDNLVAGVHRAVRRAEAGIAAALLAAAWAVLEVRGPTVVAVDLANAVLAATAPSAPTRGRVSGVLGGALHLSGRVDEARPHYDHAIALHREDGNHRLEGVVLGYLETLHQVQGRMDEARAHLDQSLAVHREVGNRLFQGSVLGNLAILHIQQGRMDEARVHYDEALAVLRDGGNRRSEGIVLGDLGELHMVQGRMDEARASLEAGERLLRTVHDPLELGKLLATRTRLEHAAAQPDEARQTLAEAESLADQVGAGHDSDLRHALAKARAALETP